MKIMCKNVLLIAHSSTDIMSNAILSQIIGWISLLLLWGKRKHLTEGIQEVWSEYIVPSCRHADLLL